MQSPLSKFNSLPHKVISPQDYTEYEKQLLVKWQIRSRMSASVPDDFEESKEGYRKRGNNYYHTVQKNDYVSAQEAMTQEKFKSKPSQIPCY